MADPMDDDEEIVGQIPHDNFERVERGASPVGSMVSRRSNSSSNSAVSTKRQEAAVRLARFRAAKSKQTKLIELEHQVEEDRRNLEKKKKIMQQEIEEAEIAAELEVWNRFESAENGRSKQQDVMEPEEPLEPCISRVQEQCRGEEVRQSLSHGSGTVHNLEARKIDLAGTTRNRDCPSFVEEMMKQNARSRLPKRELEPFSGNVESYPLFKSAFESSVGSALVTPREKLHLLHQYMRGLPRRLVQSCLYWEDSTGYAEAWRLLEKRYGSPLQLGTAHVDKVLSHPVIARDDAEGLDQFAIEMQMANNVVKSLPYGSGELNNYKTLRLIAEKLPYVLQDKWRQRAMEVGREDGRMANYSDLLKFVSWEAEVANDPLFGKSVTGWARKGPSTNPSSSSGRNARSSVVVALTQEGLACGFCRDSHELEVCTKFQGRPHEEKIEFLRRERLCFACLSVGHMANRCLKAKRCKTCFGWHPSVMHREKRANVPTRNEGEGPVSALRPEAESFVARSTNTNSGSGSATVLFGAQQDCIGTRVPVVRVEICGQNGNIIETNAMLDSGSEITLCSRALVHRLGVNNIGRTNNFKVVTLFNESFMQGEAVNGLRVWNDACGGDIVQLPPVHIVDVIPVEKEKLATIEEVAKWGHLRDVQVASMEEVELIIGQNVPAASEPLKVISAPNKGDPYAILTRLGWIVCGLKEHRNRTVHVGRIGTKNLDELVKEAFDAGFEDLGACSRGLSAEDGKWLEVMEDRGEKVDGRFVLPLPVRDHGMHIPNTRNMALCRAISLKKKLSKNLVELTRYCEVIKGMLEKGHAEKVPRDVLGKKEGVWYMPHFGVTHPMKPNKVRVVMDCAAKVSGLCLNDLLMVGPLLGNELLDVLSRFRLGKYGYTADIEAMFFQVGVPESDRDYFRFLWWTDTDDASSLTEYRMKVHPFGACSSPSIATYALQRAADRSKGCSASSKKVIMENFYVDDCLRAGNCVAELRDEAAEVLEICEGAGFKLGKYAGNIDLGEGFNSKIGSKEVLQKVLGLGWNTARDSLIPVIPSRTVPQTRRELLALISSIYDPLGIVAPCVVKGRTLLQRSFRRKPKGGWDDQLDSDLSMELNSWVTYLGCCRDISIPRCLDVGLDEVSDVQLHIFADASKEGHGAIAYIRLTRGLFVECQFVWGKARVNPLKEVTIPRLELTAAVLAARMRVRLEGMLGISFSRVFFWTDSMVVLRYLRNETERFDTFVANRITLIKERSSVNEWRHIPTKENPADDATRAVQSERWVTHPPFLVQEEGSWPREVAGLTKGDTELETEKVVLATLSAQRTVLDSFLDRYSEWERLKRGVAWWLVYRERLSTKKSESGKTCLTVRDLNHAEFEIIKQEQFKIYAKEIHQLTAGKSVSKDSSLKKLDVFLQDGLLKVGGRLRRADCSNDVVHPVVLPARARMVPLLVQHFHRKLGHMGVGTVLSKLRERFWLIKGHSTVRRVLAECVACRKAKRPVIQQKMADLHTSRVSSGEPPFSTTGIDCFGPFYVKVGRTKQKRYGVIFTCLAMRAIHIEVAADLSTSSIINAIRRFLARRGRVRKFISDNGTNFVGAKSELLKLLSDTVVQDRMVDEGVDWEFNPPGASHFGGAWEGLIRVVRRVLDVVMSNQCLSEDGLATVLCEAEMAVNSRPLSVVTSDSRDLTPITPGSLLYIGSSMGIRGEFSETDSYSRKCWRQVQYLADQFWRRWSREYLTTLQERKKWCLNRRNVQVNDIVLMVEGTQARCHWGMGRVTQVFKGVDGLVRSVLLWSGGKVYRRPVVKLVLLLENEDLL